jgi:predicted Fe-Mo cluster-binding NifX family protein
MKIAISTDNEQVSAHFGRCQCYTIFNVEDGAVKGKEVVDCPPHQPGYLPQFLSEQGASVVITGGMGPKAQTLFAQKNIETVIGASGSVDEVIEKYLAEDLEVGESRCTH